MRAPVVGAHDYAGRDGVPVNRPSGKKRKAMRARLRLKRMDRQEAKFARTLERMTPYGIPPSFSAYDALDPSVRAVVPRYVAAEPPLSRLGRA